MFLCSLSEVPSKYLDKNFIYSLNFTVIIFTISFIFLVVILQKNSALCMNDYFSFPTHVSMHWVIQIKE